MRIRQDTEFLALVYIIKNRTPNIELHHQKSGCGPVVARYVRDVEAGGSNPLTQTNCLAIIRKSITISCCLDGETGEGRVFTICKHRWFSACQAGAEISSCESLSTILLA